MTTTTVEQEIVELEKEYWNAIRDKDAETAMRLTDDSCIVTGAQGAASMDRKTFRQMLNAPAWTLKEFTIGDDVQFLQLSGDVAVIAYTVTEQMTVDGKPLTLKAADASTWVKRDSRWVCALHTESILGDPFGRDKTR
jgi:uncharacterized protein (TIGR02246 family)